MEEYWYEKLEEDTLKIIRETEIIGKVDKVVEELAKELKYDTLSEDRKEEIIIIVDTILRQAFFEVTHQVIAKQFRGFDNDNHKAGSITRKGFRELVSKIKRGR